MPRRNRTREAKREAKRIGERMLAQIFMTSEAFRATYGKETGMTEYAVTAYLNEGDGHFFGYRPHHSVVEVGEFAIKAIDPVHAGEETWPVGNRMGSDLHGKEWPDGKRSLSIGDVLKVWHHDRTVMAEPIWLAFEPIGLKHIDQPIIMVINPGKEILTEMFADTQQADTPSPETAISWRYSSHMTPSLTQDDLITTPEQYAQYVRDNLELAERFACQGKTHRQAVDEIVQALEVRERVFGGQQ